MDFGVCFKLVGGAVLALYKSYSSSLVERFGHKVFRVGVDAGFSCPNRCGEKGSRGCVYCDSQGARAAYLRTQESIYRHDSDFEESIDTKARCKSSTCSQSVQDVQNAQKLQKQVNIQNQIERGIRFLKERYKVEHFALYLQSFSNTFAPVEKLKEIYDCALVGHKWEGFIVSTRPDCIDKEKLDLLSSYKGQYGPVCVELGLQSGSDEILTKMHRGHDVKCFKDACKMVKEHDLELCVHVLTGFPGEGKRELDKTIEVINEVNPNAIKIHNLNIASGTALYDEYMQGEITAPCMTRHIAQTIYILRRISPNIVIERLLCETPSHRLASPRAFADKNTFLRALETRMNALCAVQGDLYNGNLDNAVLQKTCKKILKNKLEEKEEK